MLEGLKHLTRGGAGGEEVHCGLHESFRSVR